MHSKEFMKVFSGTLRPFGGHLTTGVTVKVVLSQQLAISSCIKAVGTVSTQINIGDL